LHYYDGSEWINICEELDNSFTVSTRPDYLSTIIPALAKDSTIVITQTEIDGVPNYNFEVGLINSANITTGGVVGRNIIGSSIEDRHLKTGTIKKDKFESAPNPGELFISTGSGWDFINRSDLLNTQLDSIVGNEVVDATDGTLIRSGDIALGIPYTLDVSPEGIDTAELADNAVTTIKILDGNVTNAKLDKANIPLSGFGAAEADIDLDGNKFINLADPSNPQDAATKNYVDTEITNNAADGTETEVTGAGINAVTGDGSTATPYVITATEAQDLEDVLSLDPSAGNNVITNVTDPSNPQDAATKNYVDTEITNNAADGTETEVTGAGINAVTGDGSTATPYVITATEAQDLEDVLSLDPSAGNNVITNVADPSNPQDAATKAYVDALVKPIFTTISDLTLDQTHYTIILGGDHDISLPTANTFEGRVYIIKNNTAFNPSISTYIDNLGANIITIPSGVIHIQSDGTNWQQIY